jgi:pimeloyl-ACP methyl ester carboxylesterase
MKFLSYELHPQPKCLVVLLPGAADDMTAFEEVGMLQTLRNSGLSFDVIASNATLGYYVKNAFVVRLHDDVLTPALAKKPYAHVWLVGPSMGGFGTLFYAEHHPDQVDGVIAFAPFLGDAPLAKEIRESGGLAKWSAPAVQPSNEDNYQRQLWRWLQEVTEGKTKGPDIYVGWGLSDGLGNTDELLADALPTGHSMTTEGGHDWPPWNVMLARFLKEGDIAQQCAP